MESSMGPNKWSKVLTAPNRNQELPIQRRCSDPSLATARSDDRDPPPLGRTEIMERREASAASICLAILAGPYTRHSCVLVGLGQHLVP
ncbi:hypothetical protein FRB90_007682, partial [Tulasnella sp. 427]